MNLNRPAALMLVFGAFALALVACSASPPTAATMPTPSVTPPMPTQTATRLPPTGASAPPAEATASPTASPMPHITPTPTPGYAAGQTQRSPQTGMNLVYVPAGAFLRGSEEADTAAYEDEKPQRALSLSAFWIDQTEVTNAMFAAFLNAQGNQKVEGVWWFNDASPNARILYRGGEWVPAAGYEEYPVVEVSWYGARAYCAWAGERLPTEAEWEKAARGTDGRAYPWGNELAGGALLNAADLDDGYESAAPVGSYPAGASAYGLLDMAGNVWEWTADWYSSTYYQEAPEQDPPGPQEGEMRVLRGGSWYDGTESARSAYREAARPNVANDAIGFRCASSQALSTPAPEPKATATPAPTATPTPFVFYPLDDKSGYDISVYSFDISPDGKRLALGASNGMITLWSVPRRSIVAGPWVHTGIVERIRWSPDGKWFASVGGSEDRGYQLIVWDSWGARQFTIANIIGQLAWSPDSRYLAGSDSGRMFVWDVKTGKALPAFETGISAYAFAWSPDGKLLAVSLDQNRGIALLDTETWEETTVIAADGNVEDLRWSPDGALLGGRLSRSATSADVAVWDPSTGEKRFSTAGYLWDWGPDNALIVTGLYGKAPKMLDAEGVTIHGMENSPYRLLSVDWSPDGRWIVGSGEAGYSQDYAILWDAESGQIVQKIPADLLVFANAIWGENGALVVRVEGGVVILDGVLPPAP